MNIPEPKRHVHAVSELPRALAPERDLWPQIHSRLAPRRRSWALPASLARNFRIQQQEPLLRV